MTEIKKSQSRDDWLNAAWEALGKGGVEAVRVEKLAASMAVTKGSFYWHFKNRRQLIDGVLDRWFALREELQPEFLKQYPEPKERLWKVLERLITQRSTNGQPASLRIWAQSHPEVAARIDEADAIRRQMMIDQFRAIGFDDGESEVRADIYMTVISAEYLYCGHMSEADRLAMARQKHELLTKLG